MTVSSGVLTRMPMAQAGALLAGATAMTAFAANSILARLALGEGSLGPIAFTGIRLSAGTIMLFGLVCCSRRNGCNGPLAIGGSWRAAAALFGYALAFSIAYTMLNAATGALILFATVQIGTLGWAFSKGERPDTLGYLGLALAFCGLIGLVSGKLAPPPPVGVVLQVLAGVCWTTYSLLGRASRAPLSDTAGNFIRCLPLALLLAGSSVAMHTPDWRAAILAVASGALASGVGYAVWYAVLPSLPRSRAAYMQLSVPAITAFGGIVFLSESVSARQVVAAVAIVGGALLAIVPPRRARA